MPTGASRRDVRVNTRCRACGGGELVPWLDLGEQPLANAFLTREQLELPEPRYPLRAFLCPRCGLSQLVDVVDPEVLFRDYVYFSSPMPRASAHWRAYAEEVRGFLRSSEELVVEVGSNDGVLLSLIQERGARVLGVDPARNVAALANERGVETLPEFFSEALADRLVRERGQARVVAANNVVAHVDDLRGLLAGVRRLLRPDGVFVFEAPYLGDMVEDLSFDTIYHEHLSQLSLSPLVELLGGSGLEAFDAKLLPVQGGSLRVYAAAMGSRPVGPSVAELRRREQERGLGEPATLLRLARDVARLKEEVCSLAERLRARGRRLAAYGAPAKGNTLVNYFGLGASTLAFATEELPSKIGRYTPGARLPVVDVAWAREHAPDDYLLLAWNYKDAVLAKERAFLDGGGRFILPVGRERLIPAR